MIREVLASEYNEVYKFAEEDIARNYFILLGLSSKKKVYEEIYGEFIDDKLQAILLKRNSGLLQFFAPGKFDSDAFKELISKLEYKGLIGPKSYCRHLLDEKIFIFEKGGAYIAKMDKNFKMESLQNKYITSKILIEDLDRVVELYKEVFSSFSSKQVMIEKLKTKRGRGICIEKNGEILSLCQSDFERNDGAVIVGVATRKDYRCRGLARECLERLSSELLAEGKNLYLQYDNLEAGKIYERLGFEIIDQVIHLKKS